MHHAGLLRQIQLNDSGVGGGRLRAMLLYHFPACRSMFKFDAQSDHMNKNLAAPYHRTTAKPGSPMPKT